MKKLIVSVFLSGSMAVLSVGAATSTPTGWTDDYEAALKRAAAENKLVLADFSGSDWCGWCKRLDKEVFDTEEFRKGAADRFVLLMIDSPQDKALLSEKAAKQNPELVKKYEIRGFPTVLVLDKDGKVVHKTGYQRGGPVPYLEALKAVAADPAKAQATAESAVQRPKRGQLTEEQRAEMRVKREKMMAERRAQMEQKSLEIIKKYGLDDEKAKALLHELQSAMMPMRRPRPQMKPAAAPAPKAE